MPGYVMHVTFAKLAEEKLQIKDSNRYLAGALIPDACTCQYDKNKRIGHFSDKLNGLFKNPNLDLFLEKYGNLLDDDVILGIYSHLYLDKHFYTEFLYDVFDISDGIMINKKTGKKFKIWDEFFVRDGIYKEYTAMNKMFSKDYDFDMGILDFNLSNLPDIVEYDYSRLATFKNKVMGYIIEEGEYTGDYIDYEQVKKFIEKLSQRFVNHINEIIK